MKNEVFEASLWEKLFHVFWKLFILWTALALFLPLLGFTSLAWLLYSYLFLLFLSWFYLWIDRDLLLYRITITDQEIILEKQGLNFLLFHKAYHQKTFNPKYFDNKIYFNEAWSAKIPPNYSLALRKIDIPILSFDLSGVPSIKTAWKKIQERQIKLLLPEGKYLLTTSDDPIDFGEVILSRGGLTIKSTNQKYEWSQIQEITPKDSTLTLTLTSKKKLYIPTSEIGNYLLLLELLNYKLELQLD